MSTSFTNIAGYRFVSLLDRDELREPLREFCLNLNLKGTILLSHEGINFFVSGTQSAIDEFVEHLDQDERLVDIPLKVSYSDHQPFNRMLVRLKNEIISIGRDEIRPAEFTGPSISPKEFKKWLDEGRDVAVLDTRNDYELRIGTFADAIDLNLTSFRQFPDAIQTLSDDLKSKPIVMFCTGGIRCEKASAVMLNAGFENVMQLQGGILGYFEECGGTHWEGECFVFDKRVALNPELEETETTLCWACREPLSMQEQESELYEVGISCPYCFET